MKPTIYNVAEKAGVSISTVSKVMNNQPVRKETKQKVLEAAKELNYKPSILASALTGKRTSTIGFLAPDISNPSIAEMARAVEDFALEHGFNLVICSTDFKSEKEDSYVSLLRQKRVDGFILAGGFRNRGIISELIKEAVPVILLSEYYPACPINAVTVNNFIGGYEIATHLISLGHTSIAVIAEENSSSQERIRGYRKALQDHNIRAHEDLIVISDSSAEHAQRLAGGLLGSSHPPTAIIACNDVLAIGTLLGAREKNMKIPENLSITGFGNTLLSKNSNPPLTTVEIPIQSMCSLAVDLLVEEIEKKSKGKQAVLMLPKLIIQKSTGVCLVSDLNKEDVS
ncbi:LacI family transcriptional regulator [Ectobacillus funiculus]|uniref:LacI family DNA-binding transcriptional regulator n=1 Tax=Ectobacillus funiculus TaxID=137993 RepID=UPI00397A5605